MVALAFLWMLIKFKVTNSYSMLHLSNLDEVDHQEDKDGSLPIFLRWMDLVGFANVKND